MLEEAGADVTTVYLRGDADAEVTACTGRKVIYLEQKKASLRGLKLSAIFKILALCRRERYDFVIAHRYKAIYLAGVASCFVKIPLLLGVAHELNVFRRLTRRLFLTFWRRHIIVIAVSDVVKKDVLMYCPNLEKQNRLFVLNNCVEIESLEVDFLSRDQARKVLCCDKDQFVFGTIGRLVGKKDHKTLISALPLVQGEQIRLIIIGAGSKDQELRALAQSKDPQRIVFTGAIVNARRLLKAFDCFVLTSGNEEAFGLVLLEAMAARIPIISSDADGPREVMGPTASLFKIGMADDLATRMKLLIEDAPEIKVSTQLAYQRLREKFSQEAFNLTFWAAGPIKSHMSPSEFRGGLEKN